jgi:hypothetical protein
MRLTMGIKGITGCCSPSARTAPLFAEDREGTEFPRFPVLLLTLGVRVRSLLVTGKIVPMQFAHDFPVQVVPMDSLEAYLWPNHNEKAVET